MQRVRLEKGHELIRGVYAITRDEPNTATLIAEVGEALAGGVRLVQYRNKAASRTLALEQSLALRGVTRSIGAILIVNDDVELALAISADGVHLGRNDGVDSVHCDLSAIRRRARGQFLIGLSCYNEIARARAAAAAGADYLAFGSFFPSLTKPDAIRADVSLLAEATREFSLPIVAIGGITAENAPQLIAAGADSVAVILSLFGADDIAERAHFFSSLFPENV